jgi:magnesium chelatase subunit D
MMLFSEFVGHEDAKLALILNAIDFRCGGVLFIGEKGSSKSTLSRLFKNILPYGTPFIELPLNITEDRLIGGIDIEKTIKYGRRIFQKGLLCNADRGVIYVDDINLLPPEMATLILEVQDKGEVLVEREGFTSRYPSRFILIASMNPEEGNISPHILDRFGMCVLWQSLKDNHQRIEIIKKAIFTDVQHKVQHTFSDISLKEKIFACLSFLERITIPEQVREYISQLCLENNISGHRGDIDLTYAGRAYAAYCGLREVSKEEVDKVSELVLTQRRRILQQMEQKEGHRQHPNGSSSEKHEKEDNRQNMEDPNRDFDQERLNKAETDEFKDSSNERVESNPREEVFKIGAPFKIKRIVFKKDRIYRAASGRRTKTRVKDRGGRYVKSVFKGEDDIAIDATIRASAPYQKMRGRKERLLIQKEDLRFKQRERKMGHLVIFVLDSSGSMAAKRRMIETKGAILSLLMDCYEKRDRVSMIVFRKERAEVVLPPTTSLEFALNKLKDIPAGGKTPLTAGLLEAYKLIQRVGMKSPETRFLLVLITDGRANQTMTGMPVRDEMKRVVALFNKLVFTDFIVVDTENKKGFIKTDLALQIASQLGADYYTIENIRSEFLTELVLIKRKELF